MSHLDEQAAVVESIVKSLQSYLDSKDFEYLFSLGSKLSFVAYTLDATSDKGLAKVIPSLIKFTEIIHKIAQSQKLIDQFDALIVAYLNELQSWLVYYFLEDKPEKLPSNIIDVLTSSVDNIELLLYDKGDKQSDIDDIFF
jgi:hypothetical protein